MSGPGVLETASPPRNAGLQRQLLHHRVCWHWPFWKQIRFSPFSVKLSSSGSLWIGFREPHTLVCYPKTTFVTLVNVVNWGDTQSLHPPFFIYLLNCFSPCKWSSTLEPTWHYQPSGFLKRPWMCESIIYASALQDAPFNKAKQKIKYHRVLI